MPITHMPHTICLDIRGTLTIDDPQAPGQTRKVVYQGTTAYSANIPGTDARPRMIRAHVIPYDPRTAAQLEQRARIRAAVEAWQALTMQEQTTWRTKAKGKQLTGYQLFCKNHMTESAP